MVLLDPHPHYLQQSLSLNLELGHLARKAARGAPGICLSPPSARWDCTQAQLSRLSHRSGDPHSGPHAGMADTSLTESPQSKPHLVPASLICWMFLPVPHCASSHFLNSVSKHRCPSESASFPASPFGCPCFRPRVWEPLPNAKSSPGVTPGPLPLRVFHLLIFRACLRSAFELLFGQGRKQRLALTIYLACRSSCQAPSCKT